MMAPMMPVTTKESPRALRMSKVTLMVATRSLCDSTGYIEGYILAWLQGVKACRVQHHIRATHDDGGGDRPMTPPCPPS